MIHGGDQAIRFYTRHPISLGIVLARLEKARGGLEGLRPSDLWPHDQDHFGGLAANDGLAERAGIEAGSRVADFCAGLGGPARYYAEVHGADVTGVDLTPDRVAGAAELTRLVGLQDLVRVVHGDVTHAPLSDGSVDAVVSQEAFLHVPDKGQALQEAFRILRRGGRLAFTDLVRHQALADEDATLLWQGMAIQTLEDPAGYRRLLGAAGFRIIAIEDLTSEWGPILTERLDMYLRMRGEAEASGAPAGDDAFYRAYVRFVALVVGRGLGGLRATAEKP